MGRYVSLSGLDLSCLKEPAKKKRGRPAKPKPRQSLWQEQMEALRAKTASRPSRRADFAGPMVVQDIKPFVSPIDGSEITSRSKLRAHEQRHGVKQAGDFKRGELIAKENKRVAETKRLANPRSIKWE